jgi:hypothetical protein
VEDNEFSHKNAIRKNTWKEPSYLPKVGYNINRIQIDNQEAQRRVKQKLVKRTINKLPATFPNLFKAFLECKKPPARNTLV